MKLSRLFAGTVMSAAFGVGAMPAMAFTTDFSTLCSFHCDGKVPYSDGGVTVRYVGSPGGIWSTSQPTAPSGLSWFPDGGSTGYTDITRTGGGTFTSAQLLIGSGWVGTVSPNLLYQLLDGATVVATGDWGGVPPFTGLTTASFFGGPFTELRVQVTPGPATFSPSNFEAGAIGRITLTSAAPEPAAWALMLLGIGGLGVAFRTPRRSDRDLERFGREATV